MTGWDSAAAPRASIQPHSPSFDRWMTDPADPDYLDPASRWCRVCGKLADHWLHLPLNLEASELRAQVQAGAMTVGAANDMWARKKATA